MNDGVTAQVVRSDRVEERQGCESFESLVGKRLDTLLPAMDDSMMEEMYESVMAAVERPFLLRILTRAAGNQSRAADMLGISRNTLRKKMQTLGLLANSEAHRVD